MRQVHRLQVLRGRVQRAERQPRVDQLAARQRDRRRLVPATPRAPTCRWAATTAWSPPASRAVRWTPTPRTRRPASSATAPTRASAARYLHLELLLRRAAIQRRARRGGQVRHVPRPPVDRRRAGVRERVPGRRDHDRDRERGGVARVHRVAARARTAPSEDYSLSTTRVSGADLPPNAAPARHHPRQARAPALAAGGDDGADAVVGGRLRHHLAAAAAGCGRPAGRGRDRIAARRRTGARRVHAAPGPSGARLSRHPDVAPVVAEPRGAAVRRLLRGRRGLCRRAVVRAARAAWPWAR